jgi:hypothetical protein
MLLPKALRCVSEAIQASETIETFLAEPAAPKHDTEGAPGVSFSKVGRQDPSEVKNSQCLTLCTRSPDPA